MCLEGFSRVARGEGTLEGREILEAIKRTAERQVPRCAVLACSDSRVSPELLTLSNIGEMFVVRVAGNVVTDVVYDSLQFAVSALGVRKIYVIGHKKCGAVMLAVQGGSPPSLASQLEEAVKRARGDPRGAEIENILISCEKLRPLGVEVEGWYYDIDEVRLERVC